MIWNQRTVLQPRAQWHLAKKRFDEAASDTEYLRQARAGLLARGIGIAQTSVHTYLDSVAECSPSLAPCCAVRTARSSGTLSSDSEFTLSHHSVVYPTTSMIDECGARVYFESQVDSGADATTGYVGEFRPDREPIGSSCAGGCTGTHVCVEGRCEPRELYYDRYRAAGSGEDPSYFELVTSGTMDEENPLLANRLAGLGLWSWAEDDLWGDVNTPTELLERGVTRRHLLRSWPARMDNWSAQRTALESTTNPIVRPDLAFMTLCTHTDIDPDTSTSWAFDTNTATAPEYTPSGAFKNAIPAMYFDIVPAELSVNEEVELTTATPGWGLMASQWPSYLNTTGTFTPLISSPGFFFPQDTSATDGPNIYCTANGTSTEYYTYDNLIQSTHDTLKGTSGGAIVVPEFAHPEGGTPYALNTLRSIGTIFGGAGTEWIDVRCGTNGRADCGDDNDCDSDMVCVSGVCMPSAPGCMEDDDCSSGQACVNNICHGEIDPPWNNFCEGYSNASRPPGTWIALHDETTVDWSRRGSADPSSSTSDTDRDFEASLDPIELTSTVPNCLTQDAETGCGTYLDEGVPYQAPVNGGYDDLAEPSSYDEPGDTDQGAVGELVMAPCLNTRFTLGQEQVATGLGVGLIGAATLDSSGKPNGIGSLMLVCAPYSDESWHLNWRHLVAKGRVVQPGEDALLHELRWASLRLWRALTFYVERRTDDVSCFNQTGCPSETEYLRPISMQMCPPNYLLRGIGVARTPEPPQEYLGVAYLNCLKIDGSGPASLIVRTFTGGSNDFTRATNDPMGTITTSEALIGERYDGFKLGLPHRTDSLDRWVKFSLDQHLGKPTAFDQSDAELVEFFCPEKSGTQQHDKVISGIGWKSSPTGKLTDFAIRCMSIP